MLYILLYKDIYIAYLFLYKYHPLCILNPQSSIGASIRTHWEIYWSPVCQIVFEYIFSQHTLCIWVCSTNIVFITWVKNWWYFSRIYYTLPFMNRWSYDCAEVKPKSQIIKSSTIMKLNHCISSKSQFSIQITRWVWVAS